MVYLTKKRRQAAKENRRPAKRPTDPRCQGLTHDWRGLTTHFRCSRCGRRQLVINDEDAI